MKPAKLYAGIGRIRAMHKLSHWKACSLLAYSVCCFTSFLVLRQNQVTIIEAHNEIKLPHYITTKLNQDNYLVWKAQVQTSLCSQELFQHADGSAIAPPQKLPSGLSNPAYLKWFQQDQLVLSVLLA